MAANRGEWAELYVLFKLLGEGKIYAADENLNKDTSSYLEIIKIIREEIQNTITEYNTGLNISIYVENELVTSIPASVFLKNADLLLNNIKTATGRTFDVAPEIVSFMKEAKIKSVKAKSVSRYKNIGGKNDIVMEIRDHSTALVSVAGFSIKAKGKSPATLFNTAKASSFVYKIIGATDEDMENINALYTSEGGKDKNARMAYIRDHGFTLESLGAKVLPGADYSVFHDNLDMIRGDMEEIWDNVLRIHYLSTEKNKTSLSDICTILSRENPLKKRNPESFYKKAIKDFLYATFSGMTASLPWDGKEVVNGGYIVAKENGDVLVYHTRDGENFKSFLFKTTKIDRPEASEKKGYPYAHVYKVENDFFIDLNFQVRFIS